MEEGSQSRTGPLSYTVEYENGVVTQRHVDHFLKQFATRMTSYQMFQCRLSPPRYLTQLRKKKQGRLATEEVVEDESNTGLQAEHLMSPPMLLRRSQRTRRAPEYLKDYVTEH